jgi:hypothetical protein
MSLERVTISCVIEGHGEVRAVPKVIYRLAHERNVWDLSVPEPFRRSKDSLVAEGGLERAVDAAARRVGPVGGVLVLLDADRACPAELGLDLLRRARSARPDTPVSVVLPKCEFEAWFLAAAASLAGHFGFPDDLVAPAEPESVLGAKEWLSNRRPRGHPYKETVDQTSLASVFDLKQARDGSPSFDKFCREVEFLLNARREG